MTKSYFPALYMGDFDDSHSALCSVGITGYTADLCVAGMGDAQGDPVAYEAQITGLASLARTVLVIAPGEDGSVSIYYGYPDLVAASELDAVMLAAEGIAEHMQPDDMPDDIEIRAFPILDAQRTLQ